MEDTAFRVLDAEIEKSRNQIATLQAHVKSLLERRSQMKVPTGHSQSAAEKIMSREPVLARESIPN